MVAGQEWAREQLYDLVDGDLLRLYAFVLKNGNCRVALSKELAVAKIARDMESRGAPRKAIRETVRRYGVSRIPKRKAFPKGFLAAVRLFGDPERVLEKSAEDVTLVYVLKRRHIEYLIIEALAKAGWSPSQIVAATGFGRRRVQRIVKKVKEQHNE
ncbi:hypothetical protein [Nitratifractor sp.]